LLERKQQLSANNNCMQTRNSLQKKIYGNKLSENKNIYANKLSAKQKLSAKPFWKQTKNYISKTKNNKKD
jgi:hypothetical protein